MSSHFEDLLDAFVDGSLDDAGQAELDAMIIADPAAARRLALHIDLGLELLERLRPSSQILQREDLPAAPLPSPSATRSGRRSSLRLRRRRLPTGGRGWLAAVIVAAACIVAGVLMGRGSHPTSWIEGRASVVLDGGPVDRSRIQAGSRITADDRAAICYDDGTQIDLVPGCMVVVLPGRGKQLQLVVGSLKADVADQDPEAPMRIITDHAELTVVGTTFTVTTDARRTVLDVDHGAVRMRGGGTDQVVRAGGRLAVELPAVPPQRRQEILIATDAIWAYRCPTPPGAGWLLPGFDASSWLQGPGPLGVDLNEQRSIFATVITGAAAAGARRGVTTTVWFRHEFSCEDPGSIRQLVLRIRRDDGIVVYLNGRELVRDNMPAGVVTPDTLALSKGPGMHDEEVHRWVLPADALRPGANCIAAEVHQYGHGSTDVLFSCELAAERLVADPGTQP